LKDLNKTGKGAVVGLFHLGWKYTAGKLVILQVIGNTLTALALSGAGLIGTRAFVFIVFNLAFHSDLSSNPILSSPLHRGSLRGAKPLLK
jgi:hypothetical protein